MTYAVSSVSLGSSIAVNIAAHHQLQFASRIFSQKNRQPEVYTPYSCGGAVVFYYTLLFPIAPLFFRRHCHAHKSAKIVPFPPDSLHFVKKFDILIK
ncbi:MAG: hypothetical protein KBS74_00545 [Clostridiales bacterium]|nr:hypothetical protein [Candidatus Cacconaster stercorequi]